MNESIIDFDYDFDIDIIYTSKSVSLSGSPSNAPSPASLIGISSMMLSDREPADGRSRKM